MEIHPSARKYGIADVDIEHAVRNAMAIDDHDDDSRLCLGTARTTDLLGVVTIIRDDASELAIHAMRLRPRYRHCYQVNDDGKEDVWQDQERHRDHRRARRSVGEAGQAGYDVDEILRRRGGRPPLGSTAASVESVRLDPSSGRRWLTAPRRITRPRRR